MRILIFFWAFIFVFQTHAQVLGHVDSVSRSTHATLIRGWACVKGLQSEINVHLYVGGPAGRGRWLRSKRTTEPSGAAIHNLCQTRGALRHRFTFHIPKAESNVYRGRPLYIHGINPRGANLVINNSGALTMPGYLSHVSFLRDTQITTGLQVKDPAMTEQFTSGTYQLNGVTCRNYRNVWSGRSHNMYFANRNTRATPAWTVTQWESRANLLPRQLYRLNAGTYGWENPYKVLQIGRPGHGHRTLVMGVDGHQEYGGRWRVSNDPCIENPHPHLLMEQNIPVAPTRSLGRLASLLFTLKGRVLSNRITPTLAQHWDKNAATAHFKVHINIQNIRADRDVSKGHGQSFGIGINFFDARNRNTDYAQKLFIHKPRRRIMLDLAVNDLGPQVREKLHGGQFGEISRTNILPKIRQAFAVAIREGQSNPAVDRLVSTNLNDYYITNFNMGWEVSSPHTVEMQITDVELFGQKF